MTGTSGGGAFMEWVVAGVAAAGAGAFKWLDAKINRRANSVNSRIDKVEASKLSKEVFDEFGKRNDEQHAHTQNFLKRQDEKLDKIFDRLDGKQDKHHPGGGR